ACQFSHARSDLNRFQPFTPTTESDRIRTGPASTLSPSLIRLAAALRTVVKVTPINEFTHSPNPMERVDEPYLVPEKFLGPQPPKLDRNQPSTRLLENYSRGHSRQRTHLRIGHTQCVPVPPQQTRRRSFDYVPVLAEEKHFVTAILLTGIRPHIL